MSSVLRLSRVPLQNTVLWGGLRVWQRNRDAFLRTWHVEIGGMALEPFVLLLGVGFGLGSYIHEIEGMSYAQFLAPGVIASYALFHGSFDSTYGAYLRMETHHIYEAIIFTPLGPDDIVVGEVMWAATRAMLSGTAILIVAAIFGLVDSPLAVLAIPVAYLIGLMIASIAMILTATATSIGVMNNFFSLLVLPMFWLSGVFFPLDRLPEGIQVFAWILPLTPSAFITRNLVAGELSWTMAVWTLELVGITIVALGVAIFFMRRRLIK